MQAVFVVVRHPTPCHGNKPLGDALGRFPLWHLTASAMSREHLSGGQVVKANPAMLTCNCRRLPELINLPHGQAYLTGVFTLRSREASEIPPSEVSCFVEPALPLTQRLTEVFSDSEKSSAAASSRSSMRWSIWPVF